MEFEVKPVQKIEDGKHVGMIVGVEYRTKPYEYTDVVLEFEDKKRIKAGFPSQITPESQMGKLLIEFKCLNLRVGQTLDPEKELIGKACEFMTQTEGKFANVVKGSLRYVSK